MKLAENFLCYRYLVRNARTFERIGNGHYYDKNEAVRVGLLASLSGDWIVVCTAALKEIIVDYNRPQMVDTDDHHLF